MCGVGMDEFGEHTKSGLEACLALLKMEGFFTLNVIFFCVT
jgi:hypothetical protein